MCLFNAPYVPTSDADYAQAVCARSIDAAVNGGWCGRRTIDAFLADVARVLRPPDGRAYLVAIDANNVEELIGGDYCHVRGLWPGVVVARRQIVGELLYVIRYERRG